MVIVVRGAKAVGRARANADRVAKADSVARVRAKLGAAVTAANADRVAPVAADRDKAAHPSRMAIPAMPRTSRPITPVPVASIPTATSRAAHVRAVAQVARVRQAVVPVAMPPAEIVRAAIAVLALRAHRVLVPVVRAVAGGPVVVVIPAAD